MSEELYVITPDWPVPSHVKAFVSTRKGGVSSGGYQGLNLGGHVNDRTELVERNRALFAQKTSMPNTLQWLNQVHSTDVATLPLVEGASNMADAAITSQAQQICAILTADCLPILLSNQEGSQVAAIHAGWRGLCDGVIEETVRQFNPSGCIYAWLGPAIGASSFEVGEEVRAAFMAYSIEASQAFVSKPNGKWLGDLYLLAKQRLEMVGIHQVYGGDRCTYAEDEWFYSYRRDGVTGRMATLIWFE
ncbi:peptidoglycan editing factor PgeF [Marinomonas sp. 2405UD68-3]|uniref:peptidoglycan editing factor PgeF n=1 Tax=Marinomonas sp. 2405UD68-3 TaxID=3391835 RepID=UPI0039C8DFF5